MTTFTKTTPVLDEAEKIKDELLKAQSKIEAAAQIAKEELLHTIKQQVEYEQAVDADIKQLVDNRVTRKTTVLAPELLAAALPVSKQSAQTTRQGRQAINDIIDHKDVRLIVVVGPCSIHDPKAALEYAEHVKNWRQKYGEKLEIVMRTYVEKPRTELGWKGFVYDPYLNGSDDINLGLVATRILIDNITNLGVPVAVERLNALTPQYLNALVAYDVIGSRNTTDQKSREYASATSSPIGFKNTPEGSVEAAAQAIVSAKGEHAFLGIGSNGAIKQVNSLGNDTGHVILRGHDKAPNFYAADVARTKDILRKKNLQESIVIDASHGNSDKKADRQKLVVEDVSQQVAGGEEAIRGVMIESNLKAGNQKLGDPADLEYGVSITDECVDLDTTEAMLATLAEASSKRAALTQ